MANRNPYYTFAPKTNGATMTKGLAIINGSQNSQNQNQNQRNQVLDATPLDQLDGW